MRIIGFIFALFVISQIILSYAHASFIEKKVKDCYPNCGRVYPGFDPKHPYFIKDPFVAEENKKKKEGLFLAAATPVPAKPATPPPPPPPPPPANPCLDHACAGSY